MLGARVPVELRIFLTAAAIVDDIGSILVVAVFYSDALHPAWLVAALAVTVAARRPLTGRGSTAVTPYALLGVVLWYSSTRAGCTPRWPASSSRSSSRRGRRRT